MPIQPQGLVEIICGKRENKERREKAWTSERVALGAGTTVVLGFVEIGNLMVALERTWASVFGLGVGLP